MTDEELLKIYGKAKSDFSYEGPIDDWPRRAERGATIAGLRALIEHVRPAPVAAIQRPWDQEGWLDELDMGWMHYPGCGWDLVHVSAMRTSDKKWSWCLPHWAIPLPLARPDGDHFPGATKMPAEDQP
jgi:hypothetical protein